MQKSKILHSIRYKRNPALDERDKDERDNLVCEKNDNSVLNRESKKR